MVNTLLDTVDSDPATTSLREAIELANANPGSDVVQFGLAGTINLTSALPTLRSTSIDATTATGYSGSPLITLNGMSTIPGLQTDSVGGISIKGLQIGGFSTGITLSGSDNVVAGNYIGTDGLNPRENGVGIQLIGAVRNRIGTDADGVNDALERNVISGNKSEGVRINGSAANTIAGNFIGTNANGTAPLLASPGGRVGIHSESNGNTIGGPSAVSRNVISGNGEGIRLFGATGHLIQGNYIGLAANGLNDVGNNTGINLLFGASTNIVRDNVISGNDTSGMSLTHSSTRNNVFISNRIGLAANTPLTVGNGTGLEINLAENNRIGGLLAGEGNEIAGNGTGILVGNSSGNIIERNFIGTDANGNSLGNILSGIEVFISPSVVIGGTLGNSGNVIAYNGHNGVYVHQSAGFPSAATIRGNSIHSNGRLGIDLEGGSERGGIVTLNDTGDLDNGPSSLQNFPVIQSVSSNGTAVTISGSLSSTPSATFSIDLYRSDAADPSGFGEGQLYVGGVDVTTDADGSANFTHQFVTTPGLHVYTATATNSSGHTSEFSASVTFNPQPDALDDIVTTPEDTSVSITPLANDSDPDGDPLAIESNTQPAHGTLTISRGTFVYTPDPNFNGTDSFTYTVNDGHGGSDTATVTITVTPVNDRPTANDDLAITPEDTPVTINVLSNDFDLDGDTLFVVSVSNVVHGTAVINPDNTITFTPAANFFGAASFRYVMGEPFGAQGTADVTISVKSVEDPTIALDDFVSADEDTLTDIHPLTNDSDGDADILDVSSFTQPSHGSVSYGPVRGEFHYAPAPNYNGPDSFTYTTGGGASTGTATVHINVRPINDPPVATNDLFSTDEDTPILAFVAGNDSDIDGDALFVTQVSDVVGGVATIVPGNRVSFVPTQDFNGQASFSYTLSDGQANSNARVLIDVLPRNDNPIVEDDAAKTDEDTPIQLDVLANDRDPEGDSLSITSVETPANGQVTFNASQIVYTPGPDFHGADTFKYSAGDGNGGENHGTVVVIVSPIDDAPRPQDDFAVTHEDIAVTINVLANDVDPEGGPLDVVSIGNVSNGTAAINSDNTITFSPVSGFNGAGSNGAGGALTYTVQDAQGNAATATVVIDVLPAASLSGAVYLDLNNNGIREAGEAGIGNVTLHLMVRNSLGSYVLTFKSATTDSSGSYSFQDVTPGMYAIVESQPANFNDGIETPGSLGGIPHDINQILDIPVQLGDQGAGYNFGERPAGSLSGTVYVDTNNNGTQDSGEIGVNNVTLHLAPQDANGIQGPAEQSVQTDAQGNYTFVNLRKGFYSITQNQPAHLNDGIDTAGSLGGTVDPPNRIHLIHVDVDQHGTGYLFGERPTGSLSGTVYLDGNNNGIQDSGEIGINNVTLHLAPQDANGIAGPTEQSVQTDSQGNYTFANLRTGIYSIAQNQPSHLNDGIDMAGSLGGTVDPPNRIHLINLGVDQHGTGYLFGERPAGSLSGVVYLDLNNSGTQDSNENGIGNVTLHLATENANGILGPVIQVVRTDDQGSYTFRELLANTYSIFEVQPNNVDDGRETAGSLGGQLDTPNRIRQINVGAGQHGTSYLFGERFPNIAPQAQDDNAVTLEDQSVLINVLANDLDSDGLPLPLGVGQLNQPSNGTATLENGQVRYTPNPNFFGQDSFTYSAFDGQDESALATVSIVVASINDPPIAIADSAETDEGASIEIDVLANDRDPDGDSLVVVAAFSAIQGTLQVRPDGRIAYTPFNLPNGATDTFQYTITDGHNGLATATVTVREHNNPPIATDDSGVTLEDTPLVIRVLDNDSDIDGGVLTIVDVTDPNQGTAIVNSDGTITYQPNLNSFGSDLFTYTIGDGQTGFATATVSISVTSVPDNPTANDDLASTEPGVALSIDVLSNDFDGDGEPIHLDLIVQSPSYGTAAIVASRVDYTPVAGFHGFDTFIYRISDSTSRSDTALVTVAVNTVPVANPDAATLYEDTTAEIDVRANDLDADGDIVNIVAVTQPSNGSAVVQDGVLLYTPNLNFFGSDQFKYTIEDGFNGRATAAVTVNVLPVQDPPLANDDTASTLPGQQSLVPVLENDLDVDGDPLALTSVTNASHGSVEIVGIQVRYSPLAGFHGADTFSYTISDGQGNSDSAQVEIFVNTPPVAANDQITTLEDTPIDVHVLEGDFDADGDVLTIVGSSSPNHGQVAIDGQRVRYTPNANFSGNDAFVYTISDGFGGLSSAVVSVIVAPVQDPPTASPDNVVTDHGVLVTIDLLANDFDVDEGDTIQFVSVEQGSLGNVVVLLPGLISYARITMSNGDVDTFHYRISDNHGNQSTGTITVSDFNHPPVAVADSIFTLEDTPVTFAQAASNDFDIDSPNLTVVSVTDPVHGSAVVNSDGSITYSPDSNYFGSDTIVYTVDDGDGGTAQATISVLVSAVNDPPDATDDHVLVDEDSTVQIDVLVNDAEADGDPLTITIQVQPEFGCAEVLAGRVLYTPLANYSGPDSFTYHIQDPLGAFDEARVFVMVSPIDDQPIAVDDEVTSQEDQVVLIDVLANDIELDGESLHIVFTSQPQHGDTTVVNDKVEYTPDVNYSGPDEFTYTMSDGTASAQALVRITVQPVQDTIQAVDDFAITDEDRSIVIDVLANDILAGERVDSLAILSTSHGTASVNPDLSVTFTPEQDFFGRATIVYQIRSGFIVDSASVAVTVRAVDDAPTAVNDVAIANENQVATIDALANDFDIDGDAIQITAVGAAAHGQVDFSNSHIVYHANASFRGPDSFTYTIRDSTGRTSTGTVNVLVNASPIGHDDAVTVLRNHPTVLPLLENDFDPEGQALSATALTLPAHGDVHIVGSTLRYIPDLEYLGPDSFIYRVIDSQGAVGTAQVQITVVEDHPPVAASEFAITPMNTPVTIDVLANDFDPDGDPFDFHFLGLVRPERGEFVKVGHLVQFLPNPAFFGRHSIQYRVTDGFPNRLVNGEVTDVAEIVIEISPTMEAVTLRDRGVLVDAFAHTSATNPRLTSHSAAEHGQVLSGGPGKILYIPDPGYSGKDGFTYTITDDNGQIEIQGVSLIVKEFQPGRTNPLGPDSGMANSGVPVTRNVLANDELESGELNTLLGSSLTLIGHTDPTFGSATLTPDGTLTYSGGPITGSDTFYYLLQVGDRTDYAIATPIVILAQNTVREQFGALFVSGTPARGDIIRFTVDTDAGALPFQLRQLQINERTFSGPIQADHIFAFGLGGNDDISLGLAGAARIEFYGNDGDDTLTSNAGLTFLDGGNGNDILRSGVNGGPSVILGGAGNDTIVGSNSPDTLEGGSGNDFIDDGDGLTANVDTLLGGAGDDRLDAHAGEDVLIGGPGADRLDGGLGDDSLDGGSGNDELLGNEGNDSLLGGLDDDQLSGGAGQDLLDGGPGVDSLDGGAANDQLFGRSGNDTLNGGSGNDLLNGELGNDELNGEAGRDELDGGPGHDNLSGGIGDDQLVGGEGNDTIGGNDGVDTIHGNDGHDTIDGGLDDDLLFGESGLDIIRGGAGDDFLDGGSDDDSLSGESGSDTLEGRDGADSLDGGIGDDTIRGGLGNDSIRGDTGDDFLRGNDGHDTIFGDQGKDQLIGDDGNDTLAGGDGDDTLEGNGGNDSLAGADGSDILVGGDGNDNLSGGDGRDLLVGGFGADTLSGGNFDDLLVGGHSTHSIAALDAILAEWTSVHTYATRVANIRNGSGGGAGGRKNGNNFLQIGVTVLDDGLADVLSGDLGRDWFLRQGSDSLTDRDNDELLN